MYTQVWKNCHASVCQLSFINARGVCVDTLTGFKVKNYLITSHNAFTMDKAQLVEIAFVGEDANTVTASMRIPYAEFNNEHRIGVLNNNGYYAVYDIDFQEFQKIRFAIKQASRIYYWKPGVSWFFVVVCLA